MATGAVVPNDRIIYRAIRYKEKVDSAGRPKPANFFLRPATEQQEIETYLSFGTSPEGARDGLEGIYGYSPVTVAAILSLQRGLDVREDENPGKARVYGVPHRTVDPQGAQDAAKHVFLCGQMTA